MKKKNLTLKIAVLSISLVTMFNAFISPALAQVGAAFPGASPTAIQLIMTFAMFGSFPMTLITGGLASRVRGKTIVVCAMISLLAGGFFPILFHGSLWLLYLSAFLIGLGQGALMTMMGTLISELFDPDERPRLFGLQSSVQNVGSMITVAVAGLLAATQWYNVFFTTILAVPTLICLILWLPRGKSPSEKAAEQAAANAASGGRVSHFPPAAAWPVGVFILLFTVGFATNILNSAMLLAQTGMGNSAVTGILNSLATLGGIVAGLVYKRIIGTARQYVLSLAAVLVCVGLLLAGNAGNIWIYFVGALLIGAGFTIGFSGGMDCISRVVPPAQIASSMGLFMAAQALASMISPYVINTLTSLFFGPDYQIRSVYNTAAGYIAAVLVYCLVWAVFNRKHFPKEA